MSITPESLEALKALCLGFALSGLLASGYEAMTCRPISFRLLQRGRLEALASLPIILFSAPLIILRNTIRGRRIERRPVSAVVAATVVAGFWSLLCGRLILDAVTMLGGA